MNFKLRRDIEELKQILESLGASQDQKNKVYNLMRQRYEEGLENGFKTLQENTLLDGFYKKVIERSEQNTSLKNPIIQKFESEINDIKGEFK